MTLISLNEVSYHIGGPPLLDHVGATIESGERIALIGRNGAGKSTLLRLLDGTLVPDEGEVRVQPGVRVARVQQEVPEGADGTVFDQIAAGLGELGELLSEFHRLSQAEFDADAMGAVQARIEAAGGWNLDEQVGEVISRLGLDGEARFAELSGGLKRRVLLGRALVGRPDVLLLDEPTNHLDIESIVWLEEFLKGYAGAIVFVTHDRRFLRTLATRILEIDRGELTSWPGDWDNYLRRREERLHAEALEQARFDRKLAAEEVWIRQGIKARRTRNEGRVRALKALRAERLQRREQVGSVRMDTAVAGQSGKKVIEAEGVSFAFDDEVIVRDFSTLILRGDRIGLIGPNGSGKSTLIRLLLGQLQPDAGEIRHGTNLEIAYYDQHREVLRDDWSAAENVAEGREFVDINGRQKHVIGYLQDFLFTPERARAPITRLSGGERNRLLLARLFARPSNLLVMDEPTNDLDIDTLDLLEEQLAEYPGTLLLVSHDRDFLDRVVTSSLVMEGEGRVGEYVGGYSDWRRQADRQAAREPVPGPDPAQPRIAQPRARAHKPAKLSYKLARELEQLPGRVEEMEARMAELSERMADPDFYRVSPDRDVAQVTGEVERLQAELDQAYARWEELENEAQARG